jgi:hypothetical protein
MLRPIARRVKAPLPGPRPTRMTPARRLAGKIHERASRSRPGDAGGRSRGACSVGPPSPARSAKRCDPARGCRSRIRGSGPRWQDPAASRFVVHACSGLDSPRERGARSRPEFHVHVLSRPSAERPGARQVVDESPAETGSALPGHVTRLRDARAGSGACSSRDRGRGATRARPPQARFSRSHTITPGNPTKAALFAPGSRPAAGVTADSGVSSGSSHERMQSPAAANAWQ